MAVTSTYVRAVRKKRLEEMKKIFADKLDNRLMLLGKNKGKSYLTLI